MNRFHCFDPYTQDKERRAKARAEEAIARRAMLKSAAFGHTDPEVKRRRQVHANQTKRARSVPVTLPKVW
jgi:hypothetical protein